MCAFVARIFVVRREDYVYLVPFVEDERECGRLEAVPHALSGHAAARDLVEFLMDERDQSLAGVVVSFPIGEGAR